jgi:hypothetical protein
MQFVAAALDRFGKEILRYFDMNAGPIAGLAISVDRPAMPHGAQGVDPRLHNIAAFLAIKCGNHAYAAGIMFLACIISLVEGGGVLVPGGDELGPGLSVPRLEVHSVTLQRMKVFYSAATRAVLACT